MQRAATRKDSAVSQRLQQAAEQLQAAIHSARQRRRSSLSSASSESSSPSRSPRVPQPETDTTYGHDEADDAFAGDEEGSRATWRQLPGGGKMRRDAGDALAESESHKALDWMQRDVERQARENRVMRDTLARALQDITDVIGDLVEPETACRLQMTAAAVLETGGNNAATVAAAQLAPDKVDELVAQWEDALVSWRERNVAEKQQLIEGFARFEEECLVRMRAGETSHRHEQERLAREANVQQCESWQ
ncbi:hypothetical protein BBJ28_00016796 [Nothophytophthora sp. Chile5]|nr:hypothetical protein BBJ28_00016796 [Nothophytophthora sp. Chile5]